MALKVTLWGTSYVVFIGPIFYYVFETCSKRVGHDGNELLKKMHRLVEFFFKFIYQHFGLVWCENWGTQNISENFSFVFFLHNNGKELEALSCKIYFFFFFFVYQAI